MKLLRKIRAAALTAVLAGTLAPASSYAAQALLGNGSSSGGWTASAPDGVDVQLEVLGIIGDSLVLKKTANFTDGPGVTGFTPLPIQFLKGSSGINSITIDFEDVANNTGTTWGSFNFTVLGNQVSFDATSAAGFNGDKFATNELSADNKSLTLKNGSVASGSHFFPGIEAGATGGNLVINAGGSFSLNETPAPGEQIPLPAAAWMGLSGLLGLGAAKQAKKLRRRA